MNETPTHLDLFSGLGGFALAAEWAGFRTVAFCEIDPYCQRVLAKCFGAETVADTSGRQDHQRNGGVMASPSGAGQSVHPAFGVSCPIIRDIRDFDGRDFFRVDLITGGFPCQPFSCAGQRRGTADDRNLWPEMRRVIAEAQPTWVIGENVTGIESMAEFDSVPPVDGEGCAIGDTGDIYTRTGPGYLSQILDDLGAIGYEAIPLFLPACSVDAKHRRMRVFIIAHAQRDGRASDTGRGGTLEAAGEEPSRSHHALDAAGTGGMCDTGTDVADSDRRRLEEQREPQHAEQQGASWDQPNGRGARRWRNGEIVSDAGGGDGGSRRSRGPQHGGERLPEQRSYQDVADATGRRRKQRDSGERSLQLADSSSDAADDESKRFQGEWTGGEQEPEAHGRPGIFVRDSGNGAVWCAEPNVGRVANGISSRVDRLKALGNAIVPQVAYEIMREIRKLI